MSTVIVVLVIVIIIVFIFVFMKQSQSGSYTKLDATKYYPNADAVGYVNSPSTTGMFYAYPNYRVSGSVYAPSLTAYCKDTNAISAPSSISGTDNYPKCAYATLEKAQTACTGNDKCSGIVKLTDDKFKDATKYGYMLSEGGIPYYRKNSPLVATPTYKVDAWAKDSLVSGTHAPKTTVPDLPAWVKLDPTKFYDNTQRVQYGSMPDLVGDFIASYTSTSNLGIYGERNPGCPKNEYNYGEGDNMWKILTSNGQTPQCAYQSKYKTKAQELCAGDPNCSGLVQYRDETKSPAILLNYGPVTNSSNPATIPTNSADAWVRGDLLNVYTAASTSV